MAWVKKPKLHADCVKCGSKIPEHKRSDVKYCSQRCRAAEEKKRYCDRHPDYVKRQRRQVCEIRHTAFYGHTEFLDNPVGNVKDKYRHARALGYRSGLEVAVAKQLESLGVPFEYESFKISYQVDETRSYRPDYQLPNGIIVETKGRFTSADRKKHLLIQKQHPDLDLRFVFTNSNAKLSKTSKTSYGDWCDKHGFLYSDKWIPESWLKE
jgi:hypothetical protein